MTKVLAKSDLVESSEDILGGIPCIKGTRIPVAHIKSLRDAGVSKTNIKKLNYPSLTLAQIKAVLEL